VSPLDLSFVGLVSPSPARSAGVLCEGLPVSPTAMGPLHLHWRGLLRPLGRIRLLCKDRVVSLCLCCFSSDGLARLESSIQSHDVEALLAAKTDALHQPFSSFLESPTPLFPPVENVEVRRLVRCLVFGSSIPLDAMPLSG
jgi:hypothetical protein